MCLVFVLLGYGGVMFSQFEGAELVAKNFNVSKDEMDEMAYESHRRAFEATKAGRFKKEIVPVKVNMICNIDMFFCCDIHFFF